MHFTHTPLKDAFVIELNKIGDERGFFSRFFCTEEFKKHGLECKVVQMNNSYSAHKGTLRGMHYQVAPYEETKLIRCIQGSIYDVVLDIRKDSPTYGESFGTILSAENRKMLFVPRGFAHGFLTLQDDSEILYVVSETYSKEHERGIRWDDPRFNIEWPETPQVISKRDLSHPLVTA